MSVFTNPADAAPERAEAYVRAILETLGERDPMEVLRATPEALREAVEGVSPEAVRRPEASGKWSAVEVIQHLADSEMVWSWRLRMVLAHHRPRLEGYDQDAWARRFGYRELSLAQGLDTFELLRRRNLALLESLDQEDLRRVAVHEERGEESVEHMIRLYAGHDLVHLRQLHRVRRAVEG